MVNNFQVTICFHIMLSFCNQATLEDLMRGKLRTLHNQNLQQGPKLWFAFVKRILEKMCEIQTSTLINFVFELKQIMHCHFLMAHSVSENVCRNESYHNLTVMSVIDKHGTLQLMTECLKCELKRKVEGRSGCRDSFHNFPCWTEYATQTLCSPDSTITDNCTDSLCSYTIITKSLGDLVFNERATVGSISIGKHVLAFKRKLFCFLSPSLSSHSFSDKTGIFPFEKR